MNQIWIKCLLNGTKSWDEVPEIRKLLIESELKKIGYFGYEEGETSNEFNN